MTAAVTIRRFEAADSDDVVTLWEETLPSSQPWNAPRNVICRKRQRQDDLMFVAEKDDRLVGTVIVGYDGVRGWIYALAVAPHHRRQGIGRRLLEEAQAALQQLGCPKVNLQVRSSNEDVIGFYERCGFAVEDRTSLAKCLPSGETEITDRVPTVKVSDNISLSQITRDDRAAYVRLLNESDAFTRNTAAIPYPYTDLDAEQWIYQVTHESLANDRRRNWAIRDASQQLIGGIGLRSIETGGKAELGYFLAQSSWGRNIMTAAVRRLCDFAFDRYRLCRIYARTLSTNPASARVLIKAGFALEGTLRDHHSRGGEACDELLFGRLKQTA